MKRAHASRSRTRRILLISTIATLLVVIGGWLLVRGKNIDVLNPQGVIADRQLELMTFTVVLGMFVIIPVFILLFVFAYRYRDGRNQKYEPEVDGNRKIEALWWGIPILIIGMLSIITWFTTHELDPYKAIASDKKPLHVQVVALQWRWLFLYPEQGVATINELRIPEKTPVEFELTADAPMSAFWIPSLGTQIYAMNGMTSKLSLMANSTGEYLGHNTNISGEGYADMQFKTYSMEQSDFDAWAMKSMKSDTHLDFAKYETIAEPTRDRSVQVMMLHEPKLFDKIIAKYMDHGTGGMNMDESMSHEGMGH